MAKKEESQRADRLKLPRTRTSDILGKQSVRATFKLSTRAIEALSVVSMHLGIKQKSLFDHLMEDMRALHAIAQEVEAGAFKRHDRVQKTYVLSRKSLLSLEKVSKEFGAPRDALVEYSILRLMPVISEEQEKHRRRQKFLQRIEAHVQEGQNLLAETAAALGPEDPVTLGLGAAMEEYKNTHRDLAAFVERCRGIEEF